ncbi:adenylyl-sulfate kinase [Methylophilus methylotrophus]|uniref:adenylyl-sulfate kinase n=1 Tax=Methylophilus methylotrophus TaxID=17 RepID=UPI000F5931D0|nr:adenylyl-sulfate kinase [Methylophilus methylotrophus]
MPNNNITWHDTKVDSATRLNLLGHKPVTVWLTGLSASGKSTIAFELEKLLLHAGHNAYVLDGDNIRHGLCQDLGFSEKDRHENIRRIAEVAKLMNNAGLIVISAFISPYIKDRESARSIIGAGNFVETFLDTPIQICENRDPKGLYRKARAGELSNFTGISAPYESPTNPELRLETGQMTADQSVKIILDYLFSQKFILPK